MPVPADNIAHHVDRLQRYGFTIIPRVIPAEDIAGVRKECLRASEEISAAAATAAAAAVGLSTSKSAPPAELSTANPQEAINQALKARGMLPPRDAHPPVPRPSVEHYVQQLNSVAAELHERGIDGVYDADVPTGDIDPGRHHLAYFPGLGAHLAHPLLVGVAQAVLDPHVRIAQLEINKSIPPVDDRSSAYGPYFGDGAQDRRHWHSDWPHDIGAGSHSGHVMQPFPDCCMCLSTVWYLTDVSAANGSTWSDDNPPSMHLLLT